MSVTFKGQPFSVVIPADRGHDFTLPFDRSTMPPKTAEAVGKLIEASAAEQKVKANASAAAKQDALDNTRKALEDLYDMAGATTSSRRQFHEEAYAFAASKFGRALAEAEAALQTLVDHALQFDTPVGVGVHEKTGSKTVAHLRCLADELSKLSPVPPIDA